MSKLIIEEPPLQVLPSLAVAIGLNEAIVLQQLHYLLRDPRFGKRIAEQQWIFNTVEQWCVSYFPFWSPRTLKRIFASLKRLGLIETCQPEGRVSRRQYYRIKVENLPRYGDGDKGKLLMRTTCPDGKGTKVAVPLKTKTTSKTSPKNTEGAFAKHRSFSEERKPLHPYPTSEESMYETLEHHAIEPNPDYDGNFFAVMERSGWRIKGKPVYDWIATYEARLKKTSPSEQF